MTLDDGAGASSTPTTSAGGTPTGRRERHFSLTELIRQVSERMLPGDLGAATEDDWKVATEDVADAVRDAIPDEHVEWILRRALARSVKDELAAIRRATENPQRHDRSRPRHVPATTGPVGRNLWKGIPLAFHDFLSAYEPTGDGDLKPRGLLTLAEVRASAQRRLDHAAAENAAGEARLKWAAAMEEHGVDILARLPVDVLAKIARPEGVEA